MDINLLNDGQEFVIHHGDCIPHMSEMPEASVDVSIFSPPFPQIFAYTSLPEDLGNSENMRQDARLHFSFFFKALRRVMKPGRIVIVHCMQIPGSLRNQDRGQHDFRGLLIRMAKRAGFIYDYDWVSTKNPQSEAIRSHAHGLLFVSLERDRAMVRGAMCDYLIKFITPGDNGVPINSKEISRNQWIEWAEGSWKVKQTNTLNAREGRGEDDVKHLAPLQLDVIDRLILLYSNPGEIVFSPFAGIGSEGYVALKRGRRFYGTEIKEEYYQTALKNMERAIAIRNEEKRTLFDSLEEPQDDFQLASSE